MYDFPIGLLKLKIEVGFSYRIIKVGWQSCVEKLCGFRAGLRKLCDNFVHT